MLKGLLLKRGGALVASNVNLRFWIGYELKDGKAKCKLPPFFKVPEKVQNGLLIHNFKEYAQMNKILPFLYAEEKGNL